MGKTKRFICEECGREYNKLPFPAACKCGNYVEDFFREKDAHDYADNKAGRPLCGVKYAPEVMKKRIKDGKIRSELVVQKISKEEKPPKIDFDSMSKPQLRKYLDSIGRNPISVKKPSKKLLISICKKSYKKKKKKKK